MLAPPCWTVSVCRTSDKKSNLTFIRPQNISGQSTSSLANLTNTIQHVFSLTMGLCGGFLLVRQTCLIVTELTDSLILLELIIGWAFDHSTILRSPWFYLPFQRVWYHFSGAAYNFLHCFPPLLSISWLNSALQQNDPFCFPGPVHSQHVQCQLPWSLNKDHPLTPFFLHRINATPNWTHPFQLIVQFHRISRVHGGPVGSLHPPETYLWRVQVEMNKNSDLSC